MQTRHRVALLTAGLLAGAQIGVASMGITPTDAGEQAEPAANEAQVFEGGTGAESAEVQADATRIPVEGEQTSAVVSPLASAADASAAAVPQGTAFPSTDPDPDSRMLPSVLEYLERTAHLRVTGASGNVFPPSTDDVRMGPVLAAYLEQRHAEVLAEYASLQSRDAVAMEASPAAPSEPGVTTENGQKSERQASFIDRIRNLF